MGFAAPSEALHAGPAAAAVTGWWRSQGGPPLLVTIAIAVLAFLARLVIVVRGGGLHALQGYDDGVYYTAAASLTFGRLPYHDFLFLHPPGVLLVLAPFAALARETSDPTGLAVARVAFMAVGALNAVLVTRIAARLDVVAAAVAGLFYALWLPTMLAERTTLLEPLVATAMLVGLLLLRPMSGAPSARRQVLAGAALGAGACVKLWGAVPLLVVVAVLVLSRNRGMAARVAAGAAAAAVVVVGPFLAVARWRMVQMVLLDQLGRDRMRGSLVFRLADITSAQRHLFGAPPWLVTLTALAAGCLLTGVALVAWRDRRARLWVALLAAHVAVLLLSPAYYAHYASFAGVPLALVVGAAAGAKAGLTVRRSPSGATWSPARVLTVLAVVLVLGIHSASARFGIPYPARQLAAAVPARGCVVADDNMALIALDVLSRDLRAGCHIQPDVTGRFYDIAARGPSALARVPREDNPRYQRVMLRYLLSGSATAMVGGTGNGFTAETKWRLYSRPLLGGVGRFVILGREAGSSLSSARSS